MTWFEWVQLLSPIVATLTFIGVLARWAWKSLIEKKLIEIASDAAIARKQLSTNGGADQPDASTYDLVAGTYRQLQNHIADRDAHER